jgi:hypothetical protein
VAGEVVHLQCNTLKKFVYTFQPQKAQQSEPDSNTANNNNNNNNNGSCFLFGSTFASLNVTAGTLQQKKFNLHSGWQTKL